MAIVSPVICESSAMISALKWSRNSRSSLAVRRISAQS
jgi:hypothetical protein